MSTTDRFVQTADDRFLPTVDVVVPVLNEAKVLEQSVVAVRGFLAEEFPYRARIIIAENGSTDGTVELAKQLAARYEDVRCVILGVRGRGRALRVAWTQSDADIMTYTDVDLSTDLTVLEPMCRAIHEQRCDVATGSRLMPGAQTQRCWKREIISRLYNLFIRFVLGTHFSDAQCGFKAVSRRVVHEIVPLVKDEGWFFDTELMVLAEKLGYRVLDFPAKWVEDPDSRVKILSTAWEDIKGVFRLRWAFWTRRAQTSVGRASVEPSAAKQQPNVLKSAVRRSQLLSHDVAVASSRITSQSNTVATTSLEKLRD